MSKKIPNLAAWPIFTARVRSAREGQVCVSVHTCAGGGYPISGRGGYPIPGLGWGEVPQPGLDGRGYPGHVWMVGGRVPWPGLDGGGTPSLGGFPATCGWWRGTPARSGWWGGTPSLWWGYHSQVWMVRG